MTPTNHRGGPVGRPLDPPSIPSKPSVRPDEAGLGDVEHLQQPVAAAGVPARVGRHQLARLAEQLSDRDLQVLRTVHLFRLARGDQLQRLHFHTIATTVGASRVSRRALQRLVEHGLLARLERRVGGHTAGSTSHTYTLTGPGKRLLAQTGAPVSDRGLHQPGVAFHRHTLAITELHVQLTQADRAGQLELVAFDPEPCSWRSSSGGRVVKPDAFVITATGEFEHIWFVEIDLATEGRRTIHGKLTTYLAHHATGIEQRAHDVFPKVVWLTPTPERARTITTVVNTLPEHQRGIFTTATIDQAVNVLTGDTP